jgi:lysosomal Pro-X carboxypeptidase
VEKIGFSNESMFPPRNWTLDWMNTHCQARFGVTPRPTELVEKWGFNDLVKANASRILFSNGLNDGWSVGGVKQNLSESLLVLNFENGAHHSDLNSVGPRDTDTEDIKEGYITVENILSIWLKEVKSMATTEA